MSILLHANHGMTALWLRVALEAGYTPNEIFVVASRASDRAAAEMWVPRSNILFTGRAPACSAASVVGPALSRLSAIALGSRTLGDFLLADRYLRGRPTALSVHWINETVERLCEFVGGISPDFAFGESTTASEILTSSVVGNLFATDYVTPETARIPADRFGLWARGRLLARTSNDSASDGRLFLARWVGNPEPPRYFRDYSDRRGGVEGSFFDWTARRLRRYVVEPNSRSMQRYTVREHLTLPWGNRFRRGLNARHVRQSGWASTPSGPFVLYPLHVQPEASVDNWPGHWRNQIETANFLAETLAERGIWLVVKDHPNFIWNRPKGFHRSFRDDIILADPTALTQDLTATAVSTFTVSGTVSLECGLLGRAAVTAAPLPWASLPTVRHVAELEAVPGALVESADLRPDPEAVFDWYGRYWSATWPGLIEDPGMKPAVLDESNVRAVAAALRSVRDGDTMSVF